jgi:hypothetical protein
MALKTQQVGWRIGAGILTDSLSFGEVIDTLRKMENESMRALFEFNPASNSI